MALILTADFADKFGIGLCDVAWPMKLTFERNRARRGDVPSIDIESEEAAHLVEALSYGLPRMRVWVRDVQDGQDEDDVEGDLVLNAPWAPMKEDAEDGEKTGGALQAAFADPFAIAARRFISTARTFTAEDAGEIAWTLLEEAGPLGLIEGTIEPTFARDRTYEPAKQRAEAVTQLTEVIGGFDFDITPVDDGETVGEFNVYASQGQDLSEGGQAVLFEFGPGTIANVRQCSRETQSPLNRVWVLGANGLVGYAEDATSIDRYDPFEDVIQALDVTEQDTLDSKAQAALRPDMVRVVSFQPDPALAPLPWRDFWLGDIVRFRADFGTLQLDIKVRVNGIAIDIDENGTIATITLTIDQAT